MERSLLFDEIVLVFQTMEGVTRGASEQKSAGKIAIVSTLLEAKPQLMSGARNPLADHHE